jgi:hypothetical protein
MLIFKLQVNFQNSARALSKNRSDESHTINPRQVDDDAELEGRHNCCS